MIKKILLTLLFLVVLVGVIAGVKTLQIKKMIDQGASFSMPPSTVSTATVTTQTWGTSVTAVGSLSAVQGVEVTAELAGKVVEIAFEAGSLAKSGDLLVQLDVSIEEAQLRAAEASKALAKINLDRARNLVAKETIPQSDLDSADATYKEAAAQADQIRARIEKLSIRAPFSGRLGIRQVNLGQILEAGTPIVSLQSLDPIYVNFPLPQKYARVKRGFKVKIIADTMAGEVLEGTINAVNPTANSSTRAIEMQAILTNPNEILRPGMFVNVEVILAEGQDVTTVPTTAVLFAPYGDSVFIVEEGKDEQGGSAGLVLRQQLIQLGERRGDFASVNSGLSLGETVVTTGVFKLRNGMAVVVDNSLNPEFKLNPTPEEK